MLADVELFVVKFAHSDGNYLPECRMLATMGKEEVGPIAGAMNQCLRLCVKGIVIMMNVSPCGLVAVVEVHY
jgi:hypothetical protein